MTAPFDQSIFFPAFKAVGWTRLATVKMRAGGAAVDVDVVFDQPDRERFGGSGRSREYSIRYQAADLARLQEGDAVTIWADYAKSSGQKFKIRESPFNPEDAYDSGDGYFKRALLSKV